MILVAAVVAEEDGCAVYGGDDQVGVAIAVGIGGDEGARLSQRFDQAEFCAYILEAAVALVAQDAEFNSCGGFDDSGQVDPSVVVEIDSV